MSNEVESGTCQELFVGCSLIIIDFIVHVDNLSNTSSSGKSASSFYGRNSGNSGLFSFERLVLFILFLLKIYLGGRKLMSVTLGNLRVKCLFAGTTSIVQCRICLLLYN